MITVKSLNISDGQTYSILIIAGTWELRLHPGWPTQIGARGESAPVGEVTQATQKSLSQNNCTGASLAMQHVVQVYMKVHGDE